MRDVHTFDGIIYIICLLTTQGTINISLRVYLKHIRLVLPTVIMYEDLRTYTPGTFFKSILTCDGAITTSGRSCK